MIHLLHVIENCDERYGGPAKSVPMLCKYLNGSGFQTEIHSVRHYPDEHNAQIDDNHIIWHSYKNSITDSMSFSFGLMRGVLRSVYPNQTIIHTHNQWTWPTFCAYRCHKKNNIPLVHSVRGSLTSQDYARIKKMLWYTFQYNMFQECACIHITQRSDYDALRDLGISSPIVFLPNGIDFSEFLSLPSRQSACKQLNLFPQKKYMLFMARIHPHKRVLELLDAWSTLAPSFPEWELLIAGHCESESFYKTFLQKIRSFNGTVRYLGMLTGKARVSAFAAADAFVLPSKSENFGMSIAEAMAAQLPVITTTGTPWEVLTSKHCGLRFEYSQSQLKEALKSMMQISPEERFQMGKTGHRYVMDHFSICEQIKKWKTLYTQILDDKKMPEYTEL